MNHRPNLYTQTSKYIHCEFQHTGNLPCDCLSCIKAHNLNFKMFNNTTKWSLTGVIYASQNRFRDESSIMKIAGVPHTREIPVSCLCFLCIQVISYPLGFLSAGPALTHPRPLFDVDIGLCSPFGMGFSHGSKNLPMQEMWVLSLSREDPWRREWQPAPVFLPGKAYGQRSLVGYSPWDCKRVRHDLATIQQQPFGKGTFVIRKRFIFEDDTGPRCGLEFCLPLSHWPGTFCVEYRLTSSASGPIKVSITSDLPFITFCPLGYPVTFLLLLKKDIKCRYSFFFFSVTCFASAAGFPS